MTNPDNLLRAADTAVLDKARRAIRGPRQQTYGDPLENIQRIANMWSDYLGVQISLRNVCMMMILLKCSRDSHSAKEDNLIDIAGYAEIAGLMDTLTKAEPKDR